MNKSLHKLLALSAFILGLGAAASASAAGTTAASFTPPERDKVCVSCHDATWEKPILSVYQTKHGTKADSRTPGCQTCHGASAEHLKSPGNSPDVTFTKNTKNTPEARSNVCLGCHQKDAKRMFWKGSQHQSRDIVCSSCHQVHAEKDKVRDKRTQTEVCFTCHKEQRALSNKPSHHPIPEGKMACSDCHNPHGSAGPSNLVKDNVNATCFQCHAEKRGPFIHNHQPVSDSCTNCHNPHGTTADYMLKMRPPFLCLACHAPSSHPGNVPGVAGATNMSRNAAGTSLGGTTPSDNNNTSGAIGKTQGLSCLNCHTDIHGSNNPMNSTRALRFWR